MILTSPKLTVPIATLLNLNLQTRLETSILPFLPFIPYHKALPLHSILQYWVTADELQYAIKRASTFVLSSLIKSRTNEKPVVAMCIMKGGTWYALNLLKNLLTTPIDMRYVSVKSGHTAKTKPVVETLDNWDTYIPGADVLLIDDICDRGDTLLSVYTLLQKAGAASITPTCLINRELPSPLRVETHSVYQTPLTDSTFFVGAGMDYNNLFRNVPELYSISPANI